MQVGEGPDPEAVRGVELSGEKLAACSLHLLELEKAGSRQQHLCTYTRNKHAFDHLFIHSSTITTSIIFCYESGSVLVARFVEYPVVLLT